jgi:hypothetical protein
VIHVSRELTLETSESADEVHQAIAAALNGTTELFELHDDRGRSVHVPVEKLAYVEIAGGDVRRVGFGTA